MKAIKRRISSVKNTQQIMKAMNLVAASKVQKNKVRLEGITPLFKETKEFLSQGVYHQDMMQNIYYEARDVKSTAYIVLSGERGLCGSYNANILKEATSHMNDNNKNERIITLGSTCRDYFVRRNKNIVKSYVGVLENVTYGVAAEIAELLVDLFTASSLEDQENQVDEVYIAYTQFENLLSHTPKVVKLLPFDPLVSTSQASTRKESIYEPDIHTYLKKSVPVYLTMFLYGAMIESAVCEQASRMTSMDAAARNAGEIVEDLTLQFNRQRQGAITQEISEIVGGANAI
jgi:F-type H+-transporting ATPase subunit gamma